MKHVQLYENFDKEDYKDLHKMGLGKLDIHLLGFGNGYLKPTADETLEIENIKFKDGSRVKEVHVGTNLASSKQKGGEIYSYAIPFTITNGDRGSIYISCNNGRREIDNENSYRDLIIRMNDRNLGGCISLDKLKEDAKEDYFEALKTAEGPYHAMFMVFKKYYDDYLVSLGK